MQYVRLKFTLYLDVNECVRAEAHNCHSNAVCSDTVGSFECVCQDGYNGDGVTCTSKSILLSTVCRYRLRLSLEVVCLFQILMNVRMNRTTAVNMQSVRIQMEASFADAILDSVISA